MDEDTVSFGKVQDIRKFIHREGDRFQEVIIKPLFFPSKESQDIYLGLLSNVQQELAICMYSLTFREVARILQNKPRVRVRIITDVHQYKEHGSDCIDQLLALEHVNNSSQIIQVELRFFTTPSNESMHHKYIVLDRRMIFVGSLNLSYTGFINNQENILIVGDQDAAAKYMDNFEALWAQTKKSCSKTQAARLVQNEILVMLDEELNTNSVTNPPVIEESGTEFVIDLDEGEPNENSNHTLMKEVDNILLEFDEMVQSGATKAASFNYFQFIDDEKSISSQTQTLNKFLQEIEEIFAKVIAQLNQQEEYAKIFRTIEEQIDIRKKDQRDLQVIDAEQYDVLQFISQEEEKLKNKKVKLSQDQD